MSPSSVKELTGSFRRLTEKVNQKLEMEPYNNVRNFIFLRLDETESIHTYVRINVAFYKIGDEPDSDKENSEYQRQFSEWDEKLNEFKAQNNWDKFSK